MKKIVEIIVVVVLSGGLTVGGTEMLNVNNVTVNSTMNQA
mgnify:CR=1 FL=1